MSTVKDPVCGKEVDTKIASYKSMRDGSVYYFCSVFHQTEFDRNPDKYLKQNNATRSVTYYNGYCGPLNCSQPQKGVAWYLYLALIFLVLVVAIILFVL